MVDRGVVDGVELRVRIRASYDLTGIACHEATLAQVIVRFGAHFLLASGFSPSFTSHGISRCKAVDDTCSTKNLLPTGRAGDLP
jgi:hypothetical protein